MAPKKTSKKNKLSASLVKTPASQEPQAEEAQPLEELSDPPPVQDSSSDPPPVQEPADTISEQETVEPPQEVEQCEVAMEVVTEASDDTDPANQLSDVVSSESPKREKTVTVNGSSESQPTEMEVDPSPEVDESPAPIGETSTSVGESSTMVTESPTPVAISPAHKAESPAHKAESPAPVAESPAPVAESQAPVMEYPTPIAESPAPVAESPVPPTGDSPIPPQGPSPLTPSGTPVTPIPSGISTETPTTSSILLQTFEGQVTPVFLERAASGLSVMVPLDQQSLMSSTIGGPAVRKCGICGKVYRNRNGLYKHRLAKHPQLVNANKPIHCQQPGCGFDCHRLEVLREHITEVHKIPMQMETGTFANFDAFIAWKEKLEKENCANFVKTRGASGKTLGIHTKHRYYCSRSGFHNSKSTGKRRKVTTKMGAYCTAGINVLEHKETGEVQAEACITHHGHPIQLEYLKIPPKDKREIASKIVRGKNWDQILAEYHESGLKQGTRSSILTKKDLMNIQRIVKKHLPASEQGDMVDVDQQIEIDTSDPNWLPPASATCSDSETEIAVESLQRLGEVATTGVAALRDGLLNELDQIARCCKNCQDRDSLVAAGNHVKAALNVFQGSAGTAEVNGGSSRTRPVREQMKDKAGIAAVVAGGDVVTQVQPGEQVQTTIEVGENAMNLLESMEKDINTDVRVPATDSQDGEDDMPVITYRLVPAAAENATCPLDSLATTSQYRTLGIRLTKEMLYTLSLICEKHQMDRLLSGGNLINREEVEIICSKLPDEVIDADMTSIRVLLEREAWYLLESAVELKRNDWKCGLCDKVTGKLHMIRCCSCNNWFHWVCVEIEEQPTEEWFCPGCILRKRMQAIQTRQSTKKIAAAQEQQQTQ